MHIFIGYDLENFEQVKRIANLLRESNYNVWIGDKLLAGQNLDIETTNALTQCDVFIAVVTPQSIVAPKWNQELVNASNLSKPIIPILLKPTNDIPDILQSIAKVDFTRGVTGTAFTRLINSLSSLSLRQSQKPLNQQTQINTANKLQNENKLGIRAILWSKFREADPVVQAAIIGLIGVLITAIVSIFAAILSSMNVTVNVNLPPTLVSSQTASSIVASEEGVTEIPTQEIEMSSTPSFMFVSFGSDKIFVTPCETFQYTVTVENLQTFELTNIRVSQQIADEVQYVPNSTTGEKNGETISITDSWLEDGVNLGNLGPGVRVYFRFSVRMTEVIAPATNVQSVILVSSDNVDWIARGSSVTVVAGNTRATLRSGDFLSAVNVTQEEAAGWQFQSINGDLGNIIEFNTHITNDGPCDARNVHILFNYPHRELSTEFRPWVSVTADNSDSISDDILINSSELTYLFPYPGSEKFGDTDLYDCTPEPDDIQGGCPISDSLHNNPLNIGTVEAGETIQITFMSGLVNILRTATPSN